MSEPKINYLGPASEADIGDRRMNSQWKLVPVEPTETMVINGFESEPDECFTDEEVWEQYKEMSGCQQAAFRAKLCWAAMLGSAPAAPQADTKPMCDHEWTDDGEFLLVCTKCGTQENHDPKWRDMESAPKDGTLLRLLVSFDEHSTEDADEAPTIGANNFDNDGEDAWRFAGWCWTHDHFTQGVGTPVGWLPVIDASPCTGEIDRVTAERDALQLRLNEADQRIDELTPSKDEQVALMPVERSYDVRAKQILAFNTCKQGGGDLDDALGAAYKAVLSYTPHPGMQPAPGSVVRPVDPERERLIEIIERYPNSDPLEYDAAVRKLQQ